MRWMWWFFAGSWAALMISALFVPGGNIALLVVWLVSSAILFNDRLRQARWERP